MTVLHVLSHLCYCTEIKFSSGRINKENDRIRAEEDASRETIDFFVISEMKIISFKQYSR